MGRSGTCECLSFIWREVSGSLTLKSYQGQEQQGRPAHSFPHPKVAWRGWGKEEWKQRHCCSSIFNGLSWESQGSWGPASPVPQMLELTG